MQRRELVSKEPNFLVTFLPYDWIKDPKIYCWVLLSYLFVSVHEFNLYFGRLACVKSS